MLVSLTAAYGVLAQTPAATRAESIVGRVIDARDSAPLRRARVIVSSGERQIELVFTDDQGRFSIVNAPVTPLTVRATKAGFANAVVTVPAGGAGSDIGFALPNKPSREWWPHFKSLYLSTQSPAVRDRLAASMSTSAVREHYAELLDLVGNSDLGASRIYFLRPINRIGNRISPGQGRAVIAGLAADPELGIEATAVLKGRGVDR